MTKFLLNIYLQGLVTGNFPPLQNLQQPQRFPQLQKFPPPQRFPQQLMCQQQQSGYLKNVDKKTFIMKALLDRLEDGKQQRMPADVKESMYFNI